MQTEFKVLDHGFVKYINHMGSEEHIIEAARQSTQKGFLGWNDQTVCTKCGFVSPGLHKMCQRPNCNYEALQQKGDSHLLEYLYKNRHTTPFEMCELVVQVKAPIMVLRQWERHRTFSYNEWSGRYSQLKDEFYVPSVRMQDFKNKQGSSNEYVGDLDQYFGTLWQEEQKMVYANYEHAIADGIAKEVARINMPVSVYTIMWAKANLHNWLHFLKLRMDPHAQYEIRVYANAVAEIIKSLWPRTYALFEEHTLNSYTLSRTEIALLLDTMFTESTEDNFPVKNKLYKKLERVYNK